MQPGEFRYPPPKFGRELLIQLAERAHLAIPVRRVLLSEFVWAFEAFLFPLRVVAFQPGLDEVRQFPESLSAWVSSQIMATPDFQFTGMRSFQVTAEGGTPNCSA